MTARTGPQSRERTAPALITWRRALCLGSENDQWG